MKFREIIFTKNFVKMISWNFEAKYFCPVWMDKRVAFFTTFLQREHYVTVYWPLKIDSPQIITLFYLYDGEKQRLRW